MKFSLYTLSVNKVAIIILSLFSGLPAKRLSRCHSSAHQEDFCVCFAITEKTKGVFNVSVIVKTTSGILISLFFFHIIFLGKPNMLAEKENSEL